MSNTEAWLLVGAAIAVAVAGLAASLDAALARVSRVRADEMAEQGVPGARRLVRVTADPARYFNLVLLVRVTCEMAAAVLVALVCVREWGVSWKAGVLATLIMAVIS